MEDLKVKDPVAKHGILSAEDFLINDGRHRWRANAWFDSPQQGRLIPHADLWRELDSMLARRGAGFEARWTKGHPLPRHLATLQSSELDAWGNVGADLLAGVASRTTRIMQTFPGLWCSIYYYNSLL